MALVDEARLKQIEEAAAGATAGPWQVARFLGHCGWEERIRTDWSERDLTAQPVVAIAEKIEFGPKAMRANARFLAQSRQDVPDLCETLRAAWAERDALRAALLQIRMCARDAKL